MPFATNIAAFALFCCSLVIFPRSSHGLMAVSLTLAGCVLVLGGVVLVTRSRAALGAAWSFLPKADEGTGLVTTGPYSRVRHPIYLGLTLLAAGVALAFSNWPALLVVACAIVPTFAWRAHAEETQLCRTFGERFAVYRRRTRMIIPYLL